MGVAAFGARRQGTVITHDIWRCPHCRDALTDHGDHLRCAGCRGRYECVDGIPDLRTAGESAIDVAEDLRVARELAASPHGTLESLVHSMYAHRVGWDEGHVSLRTTQVLEAPRRLRADLAGWLGDAVRPGRIVLDLGCGAGMLLAAAAANGCDGIGIDVSMTRLVVAKRLIAEYGGTPRLAAALGEALPLATESVDAVVSLDVIEHVRDPGAYLAEIDRVTRVGGHVALSTPNRFSLTSEPHVFVWGVGWLPRRWQSTYVRWRSGIPYGNTRLLGSVGLRRLLRSHTGIACTVLIPPVAPENIARFPRHKARLAEWYNVVSRLSAARWFFLLCGPFFRVTGVKTPHAPAATAARASRRPLDRAAG